MKAIGHFKYIGLEMHELYEIESWKDWRSVPWAYEFIDFPGKIEPKIGDRFLSWYWVPVAALIELNKHDLRENLH